MKPDQVTDMLRQQREADKAYYLQIAVAVVEEYFKADSELDEYCLGGIDVIEAIKQRFAEEK